MSRNVTLRHHHAPNLPPYVHRISLLCLRMSPLPPTCPHCPQYVPKCSLCVPKVSPNVSTNAPPPGVRRAVDLCAAPGSWSQVLSRELRWGGTGGEIGGIVGWGGTEPYGLTEDAAHTHCGDTGGSLGAHYRATMDSLWAHYGLTTDSLWAPYRLTTDPQWTPYGFTIDSLWVHYRLPMGSLIGSL